MGDSVFRTAQASDTTPKTEPVVDKTPGVTEKGDTSTKLVATYQDATGTPYTANYYQITNIWKEPSGGFESEVSAIESYIKDLVSDDQLDNSTEAADKWYKQAEKKANITPEDTTTTKLIKLAAWVKMQKEIRTAMEWRKNGS